MRLATPEKIRRFQRKLYEKAKKDKQCRFHQLYDKVYRADILEYAYRRAKANKGAPGVDGVRFSDIEREGLEEWLAALQDELREKKYKPSPVRRKIIPKWGGGERPLGIPTIKDRVVQTSVRVLIEPIFEADFVEEAYGYRKHKSAHDAVKATHKAVCEGYTDVVDADLSKYFDTIPHHELMQSVARRICDRHLLHLIKMWLKVPVEEKDDKGNTRMSGGKHKKTGTPQGGVISPLLANIYMHRYLKGWKQRGKDREYRAKLINYADDFVILSKGKAKEAYDWTRWAMTQLKLTLNEEKTKIRAARKESFDFLGYTIGPERHRRKGHWYLSAKASKKALKNVKKKIKARLKPSNVKPWEEVVKRLNSTIHGWVNYFDYGTRYMAYREIDNYVATTVRKFLRRRHKVSGRGTRRFPDEKIFGELGVVRLRWLHIGKPSTALS